MSVHRQPARPEPGRFDPRTKLLLLFLCVLTAAAAPSLQYIAVLIGLITLFGVVNGRVRYALISAAVFVLCYTLTRYLPAAGGTLYTIFAAWLSLFYKVFPCGMMGGIILSTTGINEFLSALAKAHIPRRVTIPLAVMLRYIPTLRENWHYIRDAMRLRGINPSVRGLAAAPVRTAECVYVPMMMAASKVSDELSIAAVTRGIETPGDRSCLVPIGFRPADYLVTLVFTGLLAFVIASGIA